MLLNICICVIIGLVGFNLKNYFSGFSRKEKKILNLLFFYHFAIAIFFHFYLEIKGGDGIKYWYYIREFSFDDVLYHIVNRKANSFMYLINYVPSVKLELSLFTGNMLYAFVGYLGFIYLLKLLKSLTPGLLQIRDVKLFGIPIFPWVLFLPNLHFWSSGIGKDTLLFFAIIIFVYAINNVKKKIWLIGLSLLISLAIRPHISLFLLVAFGLGYIIDGRFKLYQKAFIFTIFVAGSIGIFDYVIRFIQLESLEIQALGDYATQRVGYLNEERVGSRVDMSSYPLPLKIFTFLYRPLFFDASGPLGILSSIENLILLILSFMLFKKRVWLNFKQSNFLIKGIYIYLIIGSIAFSLILGNLGIMLRQKNMFIPMLLVLVVVMVFKQHHLKMKAYEST